MSALQQVPMIAVPPALRDALPDLEREFALLRRVVAGGFTTDAMVKGAFASLQRIDKASLAARKAMRAKPEGVTQ